MVELKTFSIMINGIRPSVPPILTCGKGRSPCPIQAACDSVWSIHHHAPKADKCHRVPKLKWHSNSSCHLGILYFGIGTFNIFALWRWRTPCPIFGTVELTRSNQFPYATPIANHSAVNVRWFQMAIYLSIYHLRKFSTLHRFTDRNTPIPAIIHAISYILSNQLIPLITNPCGCISKLCTGIDEMTKRHLSS